MSIPRLLHQTWKDSDVPKVFAKFVQSWRNNHPEWEYRLWTDDDNRNLIADEYPWFLETYDGYPFPIQRADAVRYFILRKFGGVYADLDVLSCKSIEPLLCGRQCVLGLEPKEHADRFLLPRIVGNAFMASEANHAFFESVTARLPEFSIQRQNDDTFILNTTGPFMLTRVYDDFNDQKSITIEPSNVLYPITSDQAEMLRNKRIVDVNTSQAYTIHLFFGSWWSPRRRQELICRS